MPAGAGAEVHDAIGPPHDRFVMFHHDHGVAARLQFAESVDQPLVVAGMQADRRFVEHVADADQSRAEPGGQPHPLQLAAAQGAGGPIQREITKAHAIQEIEPRGDLRQDRLGDRLLVGGEGETGRTGRPSP